MKIDMEKAATVDAVPPSKLKVPDMTFISETPGNFQHVSGLLASIWLRIAERESMIGRGDNAERLYQLAADALAMSGGAI